MSTSRPEVHERVKGGVLIRSSAQPPHKCNPPALVRDTGERMPETHAPVVDALEPGTEFHCDCGRVHIVWWRQRSGLRPSGPAWRTETIWERFKRKWSALL